jgi:hypothetical protein
MLVQNPIAILAPWINGDGLVPSDHERQHLLAQTAAVYTTGIARTPKTSKRDRAVERTIAQSTKSFRSAEPVQGLIRLRLDLNETSKGWQIERFDGAIHLSQWP